MPVGKILPAPWNYKEQDEATSAKLLDNLKRNGQVETCIVRTHPTKRGYYEMVNGNHRLDLFMAAGISALLLRDGSTAPVAIAGVTTVAT